MRFVGAPASGGGDGGKTEMTIAVEGGGSRDLEFISEREIDFRVGGGEWLEGRADGGVGAGRGRVAAARLGIC